VEEAIARSDWSTIDRYGRFLDPILKHISSESPLKATQIEQFRRSIQESFSTGKWLPGIPCSRSPRNLDNSPAAQYQHLGPVSD
jgi:hypothetical protein